MFDGPDLLNQLRPRLEENRELLAEWFKQKRSEYPIPLYGSVDIRDSGWKIAAVDVNAFPAGFNNIEKEDLQRLIGPIRNWLDNEHPSSQLVLLWPESNTRNPGYAENVLVIKGLIKSAGRECKVGSTELNDYTEIEALSGALELSPVLKTSDGVLVNGKRPDLIITNNDLTSGKIPSGTIPVAPPQGLGWFQRKKSNHFRAVQPFIDEVAQLLKIDSSISFNGDIVPENSLYTVLNVCFPESDKSEMLLFNLDIAGVGCSGGSACTSGSNKGSHVLEGIGANSLRPAVRFSFSRYTTKEEIDYALEQVYKLFPIHA